jgi:putative ABC transport system permease protein
MAEVEFPRKITSWLTVTDIIAQYIGGTAYLSHREAARASGYGSALTAVLVKGDQAASPAMAAFWAEAPKISMVMSRQEKLDMYSGMMENMNGVMGVMTMLGVLIGLAVIYVSSLISFEELKREIAVMMTLGLKSRQCLDVIAVGQWLLSIFGILLGIPLTMGASNLISSSMASDMYTIPNMVSGGALAQAVLLTFAAVWLSSRLMLRKIKKLSPVDLLRERE